MRLKWKPSFRLRSARQVWYGVCKPLHACPSIVALDDLGAGYSALNYFAEVEPDVAKIDMTLIRDLHRQPTKQVVVQAIQAACQALDLLVVAEGVEEEIEQEALLPRGCDLLQGFLYAAPGPAFPCPRWPATAAGVRIGLP